MRTVAAEAAAAGTVAAGTAAAGTEATAAFATTGARAAALTAVEGPAVVEATEAGAMLIVATGPLGMVGVALGMALAAVLGVALAELEYGLVSTAEISITGETGALPLLCLLTLLSFSLARAALALAARLALIASSSAASPV